MSWFIKPKQHLETLDTKGFEQDGSWTKCQNCSEVIHNEELKNNLYVCPKCDYHYRISAYERIESLIDTGTFTEHHKNIGSSDPLEFYDGKGSYVDRIKVASKKTGVSEAIVTGSGLINGLKVELCVMDFAYLGGSLGGGTGEKILRAIKYSIKERIPLVIISCSGGARMQEGIISLMQMAKTCAGLAELSKHNIPYISVLADPTTGGVTASYAMVGDINIAESNALIAFAGPRVIEQTIRQKLPKGFQRAEFLLEHGFVDIITHRKQLKSLLFSILNYMTP